MILKKGLAQGSRGFSLLELIIAMFIFSVGILSMALLQARAIKGNHQANNMTLAVTVMSDHIERLMNEDYASSELSPGSHTSSDTMPAGIQSCTWEVSDWGGDATDNDGDGITDETDEQGIKEIIITVNYQTQGLPKVMSATFTKINQ